MANNEEYYHKLSLPPIPPPLKAAKSEPFNQNYKEAEPEKQLRELISQADCKDLQRRLTIGLDHIIICWRDKHDSLIDALDQSEKARRKTEHRLALQTQNYERSMKEIQMYKARFEQLQQQQRINYNYNNRRASILSSNASCISSKSFVSTSSRTSSSSCGSYFRQSFSMADELIDPILFDSQLLLEDSDNEDDMEINDNSEFDLNSALSDQDSCTLPISPHMAPLPSPQSLKSPNDSNKSISSNSPLPLKAIAAVAQSETPPPEDALKFGAGDGFWGTIARGKSDKPEVEKLIRNFVRRGGNPNLAKNSETVENVKEGYSLLHALIAIQNKEAIKMVIDLGANTNVYPITAKKEDKISPLALAAKTGYMNGVRLLLERGSANLHESRGPYGENVLHAAVQSGSDEMVGYILRASGNALLGMRDDNGASPLHYACIVGKTRIITLFVRDYQAQPDPRDKKGETPLHYAVRNQKLKAIQKLVGEFGVYPNPYILKQVPTPLDLAKRGGLKAIAEYLRGEGAKTTKEMEKASRSNNAVHSSNSSIMSGESSARGDSGSPAAAIGVRNFLHTKTSQILRGTFDI